MTTKNIKKLSGNLCALGLLCAVGVACSDDFLTDKKNYDNVSVDAYNYYEGSKGRLADIYSWSVPNPNGAAGGWQYVSTGSADNQSQNTEEYCGFTAFTNPQQEMTVMSGGSGIPDFFQGQVNNIQASNWGRIRNINDCIQGIEGSTLSQEQKNELAGQAYFLRAWCYFNMVKWYGGVPIVTEPMEPVEGNTVPRATTKQCIDFILSDLDRSARMLAAETMSGGWKSSADWGRVTTGTALALKGRVLLWWASPICNRSNDATRWQQAYTQMKQELDSIKACGYGLYQSGNNVNGSDFARQFLQSGKNPEAVFLTLFNTNAEGTDIAKNNGWERGVRPKNTTGSGKRASAMIMDLFPMSDGKVPTNASTFTKLQRSDSTYDVSCPCVDRDPRFYYTFAFPGCRWAYNGDPTMADPDNPSYDKGTNYALWNYVWFTSTDDQGNVESSECYAADNLLGNNTGLYVRKKSDDYDVNSSPLYAWSSESNNGGFAMSAAPYIELRFAEVLLNMAEAACGAGHMDEAVQLLQQIRARVGYTAANNFGLQANLTTDQAACMSAILYERMVELAYEGKRFDDCRRWLLYDGGANFSQIEGAPATWTLTGWDGNTCTWLGYQPLNGQRRENVQWRTADSFGVGGKTLDTDPLKNETRPAPLDYRKDNLSEQTRELKAWYSTHLVRRLQKGDAYDSNHGELFISFLPRYYFLGFSSVIQSQDRTLPQTIGWEDSNNGGANGTFDPLAE